MTLAEPVAFTVSPRKRTRVLPAQETMSGSYQSAYLSDSWLPEIEVQLKELLLLDHGWDGAVAALVAPIHVERAARFLHQLCSSPPGDRLVRPFVSPTENGGVNLEWHDEEAHFDVAFEDDGSWAYARSSSTDWEGDLSEAPRDAMTVLVHFIRT